MANNSVEQAKLVQEFMIVGSQTVNCVPTHPTLKTGLFRLALINEEINGAHELVDSLQNDNMVGVLDGICDVLYVVYGAYATFGLPVPNWAVPTVGENSESYIPTMQESLTNISHLRGGYDRLKRGLEIGDFRTIQGGLDDILASSFELSALCQFNLVDAFREVHASNMSKFCDSMADANQSIKLRINANDKNSEFYKDASVHVVTIANVDKVKEVYIIKRNSDGKVLKGAGFFEPDLTKFI